MHPFKRPIALAFLSSSLLATAASAQVLNSIDFTPLDGTAWGETTVRLDFGDAGLGTVTFASINGGAFQNAVTPFVYNAPPYSGYNGPTLLADGALFAPTQEAVFNILPGSSNGLSGFSMTVTLDSGNFVDGSVFSLRSLDRASATRAQYFEATAGLDTPDPTQLPTDGTAFSDLVYDAGTGLYAAATNATVSRGLAFGISGNSFTATFLTDAGYQPGGVAMTIAVAAVPEPSAYMLAFAGFGVAGFFARRRAHGRR